MLRGQKVSRLLATSLNFWSQTLNFWLHWRLVSRNFGPCSMEVTCSRSIYAVSFLIIFTSVFFSFKFFYLLNFSAVGCNFDKSTCGFVQDNSDNFNWTRHMGSTPSSNTGPSADHTTGNGINIFLNFVPLLFC